jgi:dienelactone hydrolase
VEIGQANDGWTQMLRSLVKDSGMVVVRLEKAGVGDSEGGPCSELDYETELAHHKSALRAAFKNPWVDRQRVSLFGASMGANMAPLLAAEAQVRGVAVWGGGAKSWFERQLGFERRSLELRGATGGEIDARIRELSRFYSALLVDQLSLSDIAARDAGLALAWPTLTGVEGETQFGRPFRFHQQAHARHWAAAWAAVDAPVLAIFGEYDWYEDAAGVQLIGSIANARSPASGEVHIIDGLDHHFMRYGSQQDAFADKGGEPDAAAAMELLLPWLSRINESRRKPD